PGSSVGPKPTGPGLSVGPKPTGTLDADLAPLDGSPGALVLVASAVRRAPSVRPRAMHSDRPASWFPLSWNSADSVLALAQALETGATTLPRVRAVVQRGGEPALDAVGAEMLRFQDHPFASAAFAELLAHTGRPRDIMRLVTYFAVAPDPAPVARALS